MAKKKKRKVVQLPQSLETQIRTRARNLEIGTCYISKDWDLMREGTVLVTRLHANGNITSAFFLVDLGVLGVKDAFYGFNHSEEKLEIDRIIGSFVEIDYNMAHNIVYGAVEYAEDYGFKPCKEYMIAKYVLEEDDEKIPLIDIEFGVDGLPTVFIDDENPRKGVIKHLENTLGKGKFEVIYSGDDELEGEFGDEFDDEFDEEFDEESNLLSGWDDDIIKMGVPDWSIDKWEAYLEQDIDGFSGRVLQYYVDMGFPENILDDETDAFEYVLGGAEYEDKYDVLFGGEGNSVVDIIAEIVESDNPVDLIIDALIEYPESLTLKMMWIAIVVDNYEKEEAQQKIDGIIKQYPDNIILLSMYSEWLIDNDEAEKIPGLFHNASSLKEFSSDKVFSTIEVVEFCSTYCNYFLAIDDLVAAEPYYEVLDTLVEDDPDKLYIIQSIVLAKLDNIIKANV